MKPKLHKLRSVLLVIAFLSSFNFAHAAFSNSVHLGFLPYTTLSASNKYAFNGLGVSAGFNFYFSRLHGVAARYMSQGSASLGSLTYQMYIIGGPQRNAMNLGQPPGDPEKNPMQTNLRHWGLFAEAGPSYYHVTTLATTTTNNGTVTSSETSKVNAGIGALGGVGFEHPIWGKAFTGIRLGFIYTPVSTHVFSELGFGYPFTP